MEKDTIMILEKNGSELKVEGNYMYCNLVGYYYKKDGFNIKFLGSEEEYFNFKK